MADKMLVMSPRGLSGSKPGELADTTLGNKDVENFVALMQKQR
jgi:hypothetical protein